MTREEYRSALDDLICLVSCAVNGTAPDKERVLAMNQDNLYTAASRHMLTAIAGYALESAGVENEAFFQSKSKAVRKEILFDRELAAVRGKLEENGIRYMVLKGSVLKDCYPGIGMRQMADIDIFIDPAKREDVRRIMYEMGYKSPDLPKDEYLHDVYEKPPVYNFEMHTLLFGPTFSDRFSELNERFTKRLIRDDNEHRGFHFSDEDFYLYMIAHEYKHYSGSGTGLRSLVDTYVYLRRFEGALREDYIADECENLGIAEFEKRNRSLSVKLFSGEPLTENDREMLDYILFSGTFGTKSNREKNLLIKKGRPGYLVYRAFPPYRSMARRFPVLNSAPVLLPVFWIVRIFKAFITKPAEMMRRIKGAFKNKK